MKILPVVGARPNFMKFTPGPGVGGHCIPLDPHYLSWKLKTLNYNARFIQLAGEINSEMPRYWVEKVQDALNEAGKPLKGSNVLVLGVAYKKDIDDVRESPALDVIELLRQSEALKRILHVVGVRLNVMRTWLIIRSIGTRPSCF